MQERASKRGRDTLVDVIWLATKSRGGRLARRSNAGRTVRKRLGKER